MTKEEQLRLITAIVLPPAIGPIFDNKERIERARIVAELIYNSFEMEDIPLDFTRSLDDPS